MENKKIEQLLKEAQDKADRLWNDLYDYYYKSEEKDINKLLTLNRNYRTLSKAISDLYSQISHIEWLLNK